jgi:hypothetical protein
MHIPLWVYADPAKPNTESTQEVHVCSPAICPTCRKVTHSGCGNHAAQVLAKVPPEKRCTCR